MSDGIVSEPSSAASDETVESSAQQNLLALLRYMVAALLLGPIFTLLALLVLNPALTTAPVNILGPAAFFMVGLLAWYLISVHKIKAAIKLMMVSTWIAVTGIALFTGALQSPVMVVYPVMILLTGWLVSVRHAKLMTGLTVTFTLVLWLAAERQWLPIQRAPSTAVYALDQIIIVVLSAVSIVYVVRIFNLRLKQLHGTRNTLKKQALALQQSEDRYRTLIEWTPGAILVHRLGKIIYANPAAIKLFGAPDAGTLLAKKTSDLIHPDELAAQTARMVSMIGKEAIKPATESRFLKIDGTVIAVQVQGTAIDYDGEPAIHVAIQDITERKKLENDIRQLAFYDDLTLLPNRRMLEDRLHQVISTSQRRGDYSALMFLDLDNFKPLNDTYGHAVGDALLVDVATRLKQCLRRMDTVARFGGDEFVVLIPELGQAKLDATRQGLGVAEKIRKALSRPYVLASQPVAGAATSITHSCTVSIGVLVFSAEQATQDVLLKWADSAMYQAKREGRNRMHLFQETPT